MLIFNSHRGHVRARKLMMCVCVLHHSVLSYVIILRMSVGVFLFCFFFCVAAGFVNDTQSAKVSAVGQKVRRALDRFEGEQAATEVKRGDWD